MDEVLSPNGQYESILPVERTDDRPAGAGLEVSVFVWQLLLRAQAGDQAAFACFVHRVTPRLSARFRANGVRESDIDDLVQETLLKVFRALPKFDPEKDYGKN